MYTASPAQGRRMPNAPREANRRVGQRRRVAGEGLRRSWGQVGLAGTSATDFSTRGFETLES